MTSKKAETMVLRVLIGVIVTVFLLATTYSFLNKYLYPTGDDKEIIEMWIEDIKDLKEGEITQLVPLTSELKQGYVFVFFGNQMELGFLDFSKGSLKNQKMYNSIDSATICSYNINTKSKSFCGKLASYKMIYQVGDSTPSAVLFMSSSLYSTIRPLSNVLLSDSLFIKKVKSPKEINSYKALYQLCIDFECKEDPFSASNQKVQAIEIPPDDPGTITSKDVFEMENTYYMN